MMRQRVGMARSIITESKEGRLPWFYQTHASSNTRCGDIKSPPRLSQPFVSSLTSSQPSPLDLLVADSTSLTSFTFSATTLCDLRSPR
jgi:hypothetical protein